jgi:hypothetical protein
MTMLRRASLAAVLMGAALLACAVLRNSPREISLMKDDGLTSTSIDMDHDMMLASDPAKNAAFQRVFGAYLGQSSNQNMARQTQLVSLLHLLFCFTPKHTIRTPSLIL